MASADVPASIILAVAPMVDQSELAWRLLCRRHGASLCYTPMLHALNFVTDPAYRRDNFQTCPEDRPLIVQFCANDPEIFGRACKMVENDCDGIDLNLGCPQSIAKRGHYGSFLQDEWDLIAKLVEAARRSVKIPISCKIRVFDDIDKTIQYAQMLQKAGCQSLTVHGRTREQKGRDTGLADWQKIKTIKNSIAIPVVANGNIQFYEDIIRCIEETGVDGVMSAEGNLHNPFIFEKRSTLPPFWLPAFEYLDLVDQYPCNMSFIRGHLFKLLHFSLIEYPDMREKLGQASTVTNCRLVITELKDRCQHLHDLYVKNFEDGLLNCTKSLDSFFWLCKPYVRPKQDSTAQPQKLDSFQQQVLAVKRQNQEEISRLADKYGVSKNKARKLIKFPHKRDTVLDSKQPGYMKCRCGNPLSSKCPNDLCKLCCRSKLSSNENICEVHRSRSALSSS